MRWQHMILASVTILAAVGVSFGQPAATASAPAMPPAEPVLGHIPAGVLGFAAITDVKGATGRIDKYIANIGLGDMAAGAMPEGVLATIKSAAQLGAGFNDNGGLAVFMLDPQAFGIDVVEMIKSKAEPAPEPASEPASAPEKKAKLPFVILVPGASVEGVFGNYPITEAGKYKQVKLRMGEMLAAQVGGYVAISPMAEALDATLASKASVTAGMNADSLKLIGESDIGVYVDMKATAPVIGKLIDFAQKEMTSGNVGRYESDVQQLIQVYFKWYKQLLTQTDGEAFGIGFRDTGLLLQDLVAFKTDSDMGKSLAAFKPASGGLLNKLPDLGYVLAVGGAGAGADEAQVDYAKKTMQDLLAGISTISDESKAKIVKLTADCKEQISGVQLVIGGAPAGNGQISVAAVLQCKDAEKTKALLSDSTGLAMEVLNQVIKDEDFKKLKVTYQAGAESLDDVKVDVIGISHPSMETMTDDDKAKMKSILGDDKVRILVAAADPKTVVITFGGSKAMLAEALKTARSGGAIASGEQVADVMKNLPKDMNFVVLLNLGNLFDLISKCAQATNGNTLPLALKSKTPLAFGGAIKGSSLHVAGFIPNEPVKELITALSAMFMGGGSPASQKQPMRGGSDF